MSVKEFYEKMYGDERTDRPKSAFLYRKLRRFELNRNDLTFENTPEGGMLLEIGCGDGELLFKLKGKHREVWGIDIAKPRIDRIKKKLENEVGVRVRVEDANQRLDFEDEYFDTIVASDVLEHLFNPYHFIEECYRLLRSKGILIVHVPNVAYIPNRIRLLFGKLPITSNEVGWDGGHLHYFTRLSLKRLFKKEGFVVVKIAYGGIFAKVRRIWGSLFCGDILIVGVKK
jgi:ubiquinone/menaquinone biosynthesis C-methylase UbiE